MTSQNSCIYAENLITHTAIYRFLIIRLENNQSFCSLHNYTNHVFVQHTRPNVAHLWLQCDKCWRNERNVNIFTRPWTCGLASSIDFFMTILFIFFIINHYKTSKKCCILLTVCLLCRPRENVRKYVVWKAKQEQRNSRGPALFVGLWWRLVYLCLRLSVHAGSHGHSYLHIHIHGNQLSNCRGEL